MGMRVLFNIVAFQIAWFACVLGGANDLPWLGSAAALVIVGAHVLRAPLRVSELALILIVGLIGAIWDSVPVAAGLLSYTSGTLIPNAAPYWIVALWMAFATTLNVSLRWLRQRYVLAVTLGALAGPLAYYAGERLGAVHFHDAPLGLTLLSCGWACLMPATMALAKRLDGFKQPRYRTALV